MPELGVINSWLTEEDTRTFRLFAIEERKEISLTNNESAYLVSAAMNNAGRNSMFRKALVIPQRKRVILLEERTIKQVDSILDLDADGTSEIVVKSSASGQGSESGTRSIVQIDVDGSVDVLHSFEFQISNGFDWSHFSKDVKWEFLDLDGDGTRDLRETVKTTESIRGNEPTISTEKRSYLFKDSEFREEASIPKQRNTNR